MKEIAIGIFLIAALLAIPQVEARESIGTWECYELYKNTTEGEEANEYWIPCGKYDDDGFNAYNCRDILHGKWSENLLSASCETDLIKWERPKEALK